MSGARLGAPNTTSASDPTTTPTATASTTSSAPATDDSTRNSMSSTTAAHSARFHCRLSQTLAKVTTAALAARYAELGKLGSWIQPTVTPFRAIARVVSGSSSR